MLGLFLTTTLLPKGGGTNIIVKSRVQPAVLSIHPGPVLSRFDRFPLIGPRAKWGPRAPSTYQSKFTLSIEAACV